MNRLEASKLPEAACADFFAALGAAKRPLIYAGGGVINGSAAHALREFSKEFQIPVVTTLMGIGAVDTTDPLSMRMLGMHGTAFANYAVDDCDCLLALGARFDDRVAGNPAKFAGKREVHRAFRHRRLGDQQGQARGLEPRGPDAGRAAARLLDYGKRTGFQARLVAHGTGIATSCASKYAMNYDRDSELDPAVLRHRGDQSPDARRGHHHHRRRPAPNVGRAVFRFPQPAAVADLGQHGHHGLRLAGGGGRAVRAAQPPGHRYRRRCQHPHEHRRAGNGHDLRFADQSRGAQQLAATAWSSNGRSCSTRAA